LRTTQISRTGSTGREISSFRTPCPTAAPTARGGGRCPR